MLGLFSNFFFIGVLVEMLDIQLEQECMGGIFENNDPDHPNVFGLHYDRVKKKGLS